MATLCRRFPTKQALLKAALEFEGVPPWAQKVVDCVDAPDFHRSLVELGRLFVSWACDVLPARLIRLSAPEAAKRRPQQLVVDKALLELFEAAHRADQLRVAPQVAASVYLGALRDHALRDVLHLGADVSLEMLLEGLADLLCQPRPGAVLHRKAVDRRRSEEPPRSAWFSDPSASCAPGTRPVELAARTDR